MNADESRRGSELDVEGAGVPSEAPRYDRAAAYDARRRRSRGVLVAAAAVVLAGIVVVALVLGPTVASMFASDDYDGSGAGSVTVVVEPGQTGAQIAQSLEHAGVVKTSTAFVDALRDSSGAEIQPGTYTLRSAMSADEALSLMRSGGRAVTKVTVPEGLWKSDVFATLSKATGHPVSEYEKVAAAAKKDPSILGLPSSANGDVEGYLFPATYDFDPASSPTEQLRQMVEHSTAQLTALGVGEADAERIIIVASLIEGEARADADRPKVSRVIYNRLEEPMRLQMDSTVNYGVQNRSVTTTDAERADDNPYNTYYHDGLPIGPVNNPGAASITAAKNPADGDWLYFVTVNPTTGETVFTTNKADHDKAVLQFQQWCQANPGTC